METVYTERANGRQEYWTYSDSQRIYVSRDEAMRLVRTGARFVKVS